MADGFIDRLTRGVWSECRAADWAALVAAGGDAIMAATSRDRFHAKQNRSIVRWTLRTGDRPLVVYLKRHFRDRPFRGWLATLLGGHQWSAASLEARNLDWAAANGFCTPRIASVGEKIGPRGRLQSYLALEELSGMVALHEAIPAAANRLPPSAFAFWKRGLTVALATTIARLHRLRRFHKDLYLCHFFVPERSTQSAPPSWDAELAMIDLHRLSHHPLTGAWWRLKDLAQLLYSSDIVGVTARDRLRFARLYAGAQRNSLGWRLTRWAVGVRWRNYRRHNEARKLQKAA
jgi:lipopolysaccharide kinase (Kdo/WaaP) family protein